MGKVIKYKFLPNEINCGTADQPDIEQIFLEKEIYCATEEAVLANIPVVEKEAYNGEFTIEDDGQPEPLVEPTQLDRVEAQVAYTAMMTDTLLEV